MHFSSCISLILEEYGYKLMQQSSGTGHNSSPLNFINKFYMRVFTHIFLVCRIYLFGVLHYFQHCTGHIMTGKGNQYVQFVRVWYCKLPTNGKQLPAFPLEAVPGTEPRPQMWEARVLVLIKDLS